MIDKKKLIIIDGIDGAGKSTQLDMLPYMKINFPNYNSDTGKLIRKYLDGAMPLDVYSASVLYALDRKCFKMPEGDVENDIVVSGRYTSSNIIHQMSRLNQSNWDGYIEWLFDLEYEKMKIKKPDAVIFLDIDPEVSKAHMTGRVLDIHEQNLEYQKKCREAGLYAAEKLNWEVIGVTTIENTNFGIEKYIKSKIKKQEE
ncbi:MAG: deoxynucleoside kinase [Ruminococcus sp.]|jgi:dTMP kinase|nr:deoxynucleoside kinase [Ruminococcus sp.]